VRGDFRTEQMGISPDKKELIEYGQTQAIDARRRAFLR
jgi:hypothetical protein